MIGLILYLIGAAVFFYIPNPEIAAWGAIIFLIGMVFHWRFWIPFILGAVGGFLLFKN